MKKLAGYIAALVLVSSLALQGCSSGGKNEDTTENESTPDTSVETTAETEEETEAESEETLPTPPKPEEVEVIKFVNLFLEKDPIYENGTLALYFTDHEIWYDDTTKANVGIVADGEAYTISADIDFDSYPDMKTEDDYCGIALVPTSPIDPGEYKITVTFENYKTEFEITIE